MADTDYPLDLRHLTPVYLALLIGGGQVGLPAMVLTASVCRKVTWHPTIINFCITWIVYSVIFCLYLYAGDDPNSKVCVVQACMAHGATPMAVVAALAIVLHTWTTLQCLGCSILSRVPRTVYLILMLGMPYLVLVMFSVGTFVVSRPQLAYSNGLYCLIQLGRPAVVVPSFCAAVMVIILALEVVITIQYYRQWKNIKASFPLVTRTPSRPLCFRIGLFCLYSCVTLTSAVLFLSDIKTDVTYMLPAALPLGALIVFGLREGVVSLWTTVLGRPKQSGSLEMWPSARVASRSDPTLTPVELSEGSHGDPTAPV